MASRSILLMAMPADDPRLGVSRVAEYLRHAGRDVVCRADPAGLLASAGLDVRGTSTGACTRLELPPLPAWITSLRGAVGHSTPTAFLDGPVSLIGAQLAQPTRGDGVSADFRPLPALVEWMLETRTGRLHGAGS